MIINVESVHIRSFWNRDIRTHMHGCETNHDITLWVCILVRPIYLTMCTAPTLRIFTEMMFEINVLPKDSQHIPVPPNKISILETQ